MPSRSLILDHPRRAEIEAAILSGRRSWLRLSEEFGVPYGVVRRYAQRLAGPTKRANVAPAPEPTAVAPSDPVRTFRDAFGGMEPMDHQVAYLTEPRDLVFRKGRQVGATQAAAALMIDCARSRAGTLATVISPSLRQSAEVAMRARLGLMELGEGLVQDSVSLLRLRNGSRILSLPGTDRSVRGYASDLLVVDEASWVPDLTWNAARPTVIATGGRIVVQSTPGMPVGFFYELATATPEGWAGMVVRSEDVPTIDREDLERERRQMSPALFAAEYGAEFSVASIVGALWTESDWERLIRTPEQEAAR